MEKELSFSIDSKYITETARKKLFSDFDMIGAVKILKSIKPTKGIGQAATLFMLYKILDGQLGYTGVYPGEIISLQDEDKSGMLQNWFSIVKSTIDDLTAENEKFMQLLEVCQDILPEDKLREINARMEENIFCLETEEIINRVRNVNDDELGFLDKNGIFHSVDFGSHEMYASDVAFDLYRDDAMSYRDECIKKGLSTCYTDFLVYKKGYCLVHNPDFTTVKVERPSNISKAQIDWLYDLYTKHGMIEKANDIIY